MIEDTPQVIRIIKGDEITEIPAKAGETVLFAAKINGVALPSSCKVGICATCMARLKQGRVTMRNNQALDAQELADGWVLVCQSVPQTPLVTLEYKP